MSYWLIVIFHLVVMPLAAIHVLVSKRDHRAALGWIGVVVLFPVAGPVIYFLLGINRVRTKAKVFAGHHLPMMYFGYERASREGGDYQDPITEHTQCPYLASVGGRATRQPLIIGNNIELLINGEQMFPRLIEAINGAHDYILISSYLFSADGIGKKVIESLCQAVQRGVSISVLIDGIGAWYSLSRVVDPLRRAGVEVHLFRPPALLPPTLDINLRNHRKIAVVDAQFGFFGGINIDSRHMVEDSDNHNITEDLHFLARGPVVQALQDIFARDWHLTTGEALELKAYTQSPTGTTVCRVIEDGPDDNLDNLSTTMTALFSAARRDLTIMMPYFLPDREMLSALRSAKLRGVQVRVVIPEHSNLSFVDWATRNMLWELLLWDVEIYFKPLPFAHTKLVLIDGQYILAGSANLDARSLRLNYELGVEIFDTKLGEKLTGYVNSAISKSRRISLEEMDARPFWQRVRDAFCWLFSSYL